MGGDTKHETIIRVENLEKNYKIEGSTENIPVLKGINLEVKATDFVIIYGPSGSGKSTLLHHIVGLEVPSKGKVIVRGTDLSNLDSEERSVFRADQFGMVYQLWYWIRSLNVWENVAVPLYISGVDYNQAKIQALKALESVGMSKYAEKKPMQLSGGEQQRVGLARALINNPWILVADEPTGNLDTHSADQVIQLLQDLNIRRKRTIVMVTHNLAYLPVATKSIALKDGLVVSSDTGQVKEQIRKELKGVI